MTARVFYEAERMRWPELHNAPISDRWAKRAIKKLARHFFGNGTDPVTLTFGRKGTSWSWGGWDGVLLAEERDWLIFAHEFAHVIECRLFGDTRHRKRLADIVDRVCRYIVKKGWAETDLEGQIAAFEPLPPTGDKAPLYPVGGRGSWLVIAAGPDSR